MSGTPFKVAVTADASVIVPRTVTVTVRTSTRSLGLATITTGGSLSRTSVRVTCVRFPAASTATNVRVLSPAVSATSPLKLPSAATTKAAPFTVSVVFVSSLTVPLTCTVAAWVTSPAAGACTVIVGGVWSTVTCRATLVAFPAASVAVTVTKLIPFASVMRCEKTWLTESIASGCPLMFAVTLVRSVIVPVTVNTESARTVAPSGREVSVTTGGWVSRITVRLESVRLPAASTATNASVFGPSAASGTLTVKPVWPAVPGVTDASSPFTLIFTAVCSITVPTASTALCRVMKPGTGAVMVSRGASESVARPHTVNREPGAPWS